MNTSPRITSLRVAFLLIAAFCASSLHAQMWYVATTRLSNLHGLYDVAYGNGRFVATLPYLAYASAIWSEDGTTWHTTTAATGPRYGGRVLFLRGAFYQLCDDGLWRSSDGDQWQKVKSIPMNAQLYSNQMASSGTTLMLSTSPTDGTCLYTSDFSTFQTTGPLPTAEVAGTVINVNGIVYFSGRYFVWYSSQTAAGFSYLVASTSDNHTWTRVAAVEGAVSMAAGNGRLLARVGPYLYHSTDGLTFVSAPEPSAADGWNLSFDGGRFIYGSNLYASTDGLTWAPLAAISYPRAAANQPRLTYGNGRYVAVGTIIGDSGSLSNANYVAYLDVAGPPSIARPPAALAATIGQTASLSVTAGGGDLTYQWRKDGAAIAGATNNVLQWSPITAEDAGNYTVTVANTWGTVESDAATVSVTAADPARLTNFSLRAIAADGDSTLILGFTVDGDGTKPLTIRGVGPGLAAFAIPGTLPDPRLGIYEGLTQTLTNDNWTQDDGHTLGAFPLTTGSNDAVLRAEFLPKTYTVQVTGAPGTSGEALAEIYDGAAGNAAARLVNLSARTSLSDGQRLIVGFHIRGATTKSWIIRAIGPTLSTFGLATAHPDPRLEFYVGAAMVDENDQWAGNDGRDSGAFPLPTGSKDAVLVRALSPGDYTVHVLGAAGTHGIVLVEIYEAR